MERRFGHDFSTVRVHTGPRDAQAASMLRARAFAVGRDIVFGAGEYQPLSERGEQLLAHELTHAMQQSAAPPRVMRKPFDDREEEEGPGSPLLAGDPELIRIWNGSLVVGIGASGEFVEKIQLALLADDPAALPQFGADAKFGDETKAAIVAYQQRHELAIDGVVGAQTLRSLDRPAQVETPVSAPMVSQPVPSKKKAPWTRLEVPSSSMTQPDLVFPWYHKVKGEKTFVEKAFDPVPGPQFTTYVTLSLAGSVTIGPAASMIVASKEEMTLEFEKFATSLTFKGTTPQDISFSSASVDLGKSDSVDFGFDPLSVTSSRKLPKEIVLGKSKLSGELTVRLKFRFEPNRQPAPKPIDVPFWLRVAAVGAATIKISEKIAQGVLTILGRVATAPAMFIIIIVPPTDNYSRGGQSFES